MITKLWIKNFKLIKELSLDCKRINVFIGEPNSGKSNILETIGLFSFAAFSHTRMERFVRFERLSNLFYDEDLAENVGVVADDFSLVITFREGNFEGLYRTAQPPADQSFDFRGAYSGITAHGGTPGPFLPFKFYRFTRLEEFKRERLDFLEPPDGQNLLALLRVNKELRSTVVDIFKSFGLRLHLRSPEQKIELLKEKEHEEAIISYPYSLVSDTLQRLGFYLAAVRSNNDSVIAFEEPEAHAFPYYTKYLAETRK